MLTALHWFRRDFRTRDNTALRAAAANHDAVAGVFIIDPRWFGNPEKMGAHQATFWLAALAELKETLAGRNIALIVRTNRDPVTELLKLAKETSAQTITFNKDNEPDQISMDERLEREAAKVGLKIVSFKDAVIFEEEEILTNAGGIYSVFTPYKRAYLKRLTAEPFAMFDPPRKLPRSVKARSEKLPSAESLGYPHVELFDPPGESAAHNSLNRFVAGPIYSYANERNFPAAHGTSQLSPHLNAGTLSIRQAMRAALDAAAALSPKRADAKVARASADTFLAELIWREFYRMILFHYPHTVSKPFQQKTARITWQNDPALFTAWSTARTGIPIIDAAMLQLRATGFMHNRLRMIAAMFLTKNLDTHWVRGERFFMRSLIDYDQACNVGGWQWSSSTGTDAAPYFRIMNPVLQSERFDPKGIFIRKYIPALQKVPLKFLHAPWQMPLAVQNATGCIIGHHYPNPIVDLAASKAGAIAKFRAR